MRLCFFPILFWALVLSPGKANASSSISRAQSHFDRTVISAQTPDEDMVRFQGFYKELYGASTFEILQKLREVIWQSYSGVMSLPSDPSTGCLVGPDHLVVGAGAHAAIMANTIKANRPSQAQQFLIIDKRPISLVSGFARVQVDLNSPMNRNNLSAVASVESRQVRETSAQIQKDILSSLLNSGLPLLDETEFDKVEQIEQRLVVHLTINGRSSSRTITRQVCIVVKSLTLIPGEGSPKQVDVPSPGFSISYEDLMWYDRVLNAAFKSGLPVEDLVTPEDIKMIRRIRDSNEMVISGKGPSALGLIGIIAQRARNYTDALGLPPKQITWLYGVSSTRELMEGVVRDQFLGKSHPEYSTYMSSFFFNRYEQTAEALRTLNIKHHKHTRLSVGSPSWGNKLILGQSSRWPYFYSYSSTSNPMIVSTHGYDRDPLDNRGPFRFKRRSPERGGYLESEIFPNVFLIGARSVDEDRLRHPTGSSIIGYSIAALKPQTISLTQFLLAKRWEPWKASKHHLDSLSF